MEELFTLENLIHFKEICNEVFFVTTSTSKNKTLVNNTKKDIQKILCKNNFNITSTLMDISSQDWDKEKICFFKTLLEINWHQILYQKILDHTKIHGDCMVEFDWAAKLVLGTSRLKCMKYPLLELLFHTEDSDGNHKKKVFHLKKDALARLIDALEGIA